jgi:hypothetical protein
MNKIKNELYNDASEYGVLHNEDCCVNFDDARSCDVGVGPVDCCPNMRMIKAILDNAAQRFTEYFSHDIEFDSEEQRKAAVEMYLEDFNNR